MVGVTGVDHTPPVEAAVAVAAVGAVSAGALALGSILGGTVGALGVVVTLIGVLRGWLSAVGGGATLSGLGLLLAGLGNAPPGSLLVGAVGTVLLWDLGDHAVGIGQQLTAEAEAGRLVAVHAAVSVAVGIAVASVGYGIFTAASGGQPAVGVLFLLAGAIGLAVALR